MGRVMGSIYRSILWGSVLVGLLAVLLFFSKYKQFADLLEANRRLRGGWFNYKKSTKEEQEKN